MQCAGCKKTFTNEGLYRRHMNKKTPCVVATVPTPPKVATEPGKTKCVNCGMEFTTRGINKHMKSCLSVANKVAPAKLVAQPPAKTPEDINKIFAEAFSPKNFNAQTINASQMPLVPDEIVDEDLPLEEQVRLLRKENKTLREVIKNLSSRGMMNGTNTTNNITSNNTININLYGFNVTDLNPTQLIEYMNESIKQINDIGGQYMKLNYDGSGNVTGYTSNYDMILCSRRRMYYALIDEFLNNQITIGSIGTIEERNDESLNNQITDDTANTPIVSDVSEDALEAVEPLEATASLEEN